MSKAAGRRYRVELAQAAEIRHELALKLERKQRRLGAALSWHLEADREDGDGDDDGGEGEHVSGLSVEETQRLNEKKTGLVTPRGQR